MKKTYKYMFLTILLALVFIFGSMAGMNIILQIRENQLLSESGIAVIESPVRAWQGRADGTDETDKNTDEERYSLTTMQVKDVVERWNNRQGEILHNPVEGQISMMEAVREGEEWLKLIGMKEEVYGTDTELNFVRATLSVGMQKDALSAPLEPYYSFWTVHFSGSYLDAVLYLNAVTGRVWSARITLYDNLPRELPYEKLRQFVEMAGLQAAEDTISVNEEGTQAVLMLEDNLLYAQLKYQNVTIEDNSMVEYTSNGLLHDRYVIVSYEILAD